MRIKNSIAVNFFGGAWVALLMVVTTPWFVSRLGLEGYGLIGFWLLLFYISLIFDFGMGSTLARELARCKGRGGSGQESQALLRLLERPVALIALAMLVALALNAPWLAKTWLTVKGYGATEVTLSIRWMAVSVAAQFLMSFYTTALGGLQKQLHMVAMQVLANSLRYLGGAAVIAITGHVADFFVFQGVAALAVAALSRRVVLAQINAAASGALAAAPVLTLRSFASFSGGMFLTALFSAAVSNADRVVVSKLLPADMLGRYTVAATAIGLLQMFIFAFHRVYQPRFAELSAADALPALRRTYYQACMTVGATIIPMATVFIVYTPEVFRLWLGWTDEGTTVAARTLVLGYVLAGVMWLPASYQQAIGWTRLNAWLMAGALILGVPALVLSIQRFGLAGAGALMLTHGVLQISVGLVLMNRVCFPGENLRWLGRVVLAPVLLSLPVVALLRWLMPTGLGAVASAGWISLSLAAVFVLIYWTRDRIRSVEAAG